MRRKWRWEGRESVTTRFQLVRSKNGSDDGSSSSSAIRFAAAAAAETASIDACNDDVLDRVQVSGLRGVFRCSTNFTIVCLMAETEPVNTFG